MSKVKKKSLKELLCVISMIISAGFLVCIAFLLTGNNKRIVNNTKIESRELGMSNTISAYPVLAELADDSYYNGYKISIGDYEISFDNFEDASQVMTNVINYYKYKIGDEYSNKLQIKEINVKDMHIYKAHVEGADNSIDKAVGDIIEQVSLSKGSINIRGIYSYTEPYTEVITYKYDSNMYEGERLTEKKGKNGCKKVTDELYFVNGDIVSQKNISSDISTVAEPEVIRVGTKVRPDVLWPVTERNITSEFGSRWGAVHKGIDIGVATNTKVCAAMSGTVSRAERIGTYGLCVIITRADGYETRYAHLSRIEVNVGEDISAGQEIARSGNTGRSTGPHLHFEIRKDGEPLNPTDFLGRD